MTNLILCTRGLHAAEGNSLHLIDNRGICLMETRRQYTHPFLSFSRSSP
jgi:hypothetical protein